MIQTNASGKSVVGLTSSRGGQQSASWFSRHPQEVSDASRVEFEQLMAAMGYRRHDPAVGNNAGATIGTR